MSTLVEQYDRDAALYDAHWQPVLDAPVLRLLDRVEPSLTRLGRAGTARPDVVDVGTGTGALAVAAALRWPAARVIGVDPSTGMLARARARANGAGLVDGAVGWRVGAADALPLADGSADVALSSFVLQLVPERRPALAEVLRVLRRGGCFAFVTWLDRGPDFEPDVEFDEAVADLGIKEPEPDEPELPRAGDFRSLRAAEHELRRCGFREVAVRSDALEHAWSPEGYLAFKRAYDEQALFATLDGETSERLMARVAERWQGLPPGAFTFRAELVSALATKP